MSDKKLISVVMTSYNHEKYVLDAIESVLKQSYSNFEFIIADDGSSDNTAAIIAKLSPSDERIQFYPLEKNIGACAALERCFDHAKGHYIALINSDDVWNVDKLTKQIDFLEQNPDVGAVFSRVQTINEMGQSIEHPLMDVFNKPKNRSRHEWLNQFFLNGNCICHPSMLVRRSSYANAGGIYKKKLASIPDLDMWVRLCLKENIYIFEERLIGFRILDSDKNESADTAPNRIRYLAELPIILENYLTIKTVEEFRLIFPEQPLFDDPLLLHWYIAKLALAQSGACHQYFGMQLLYKIFESNESVQALDKAGFDVTDLHRLAKTVDVFNIALQEKNSQLKVKYRRIRRISIALLLTVMAAVYALTWS